MRAQRQLRRQRRQRWAIGYWLPGRGWATGSLPRAATRLPRRAPPLTLHARVRAVRRPRRRAARGLQLLLLSTAEVRSEEGPRRYVAYRNLCGE